MSKTTPEEAKALAEKYGWQPRGVYPGAFAFYPDQLAALIFEVRGVDAEPLCHVVGFPEAGRKECQLPKGHKGYHQDGSVRWLGYFTTPSQPAINRYCKLGMCVKSDRKHEPSCGQSQPAEPEWIDDPHDIEQGLMRNPKWKPSEPAAPVELPVVAWVDPEDLIEQPREKACKFGTAGVFTTRKTSIQELGLVKLSDAQAAVAAAGRTPS